MASQGPPVPATDPVPAAGPFGPLFADGRRQHLRPGAILFSEGDISSRVALILSGRLKVSSFSEDGRETVLGLRGRGDLFGEFAAIDGHPHSATVTVVEPTEALIVPADRFVAALEARPQLALELLRGVILRLRDADRRRVEFAGLSVDGRIARRLVELADGLVDQLGDEGLDPGAPPMLSTTQAELAAWAGCSREAVNKAIGRFRDQGLISVSRGHIAVLDLEGLRGRIDG
jgi:CRP/FNR family cyclic AMP-dependent transcriptional regulator